MSGEESDRPLTEELAQLRATTARLEEKVKEGQTSLVAALRTLIIDYREFIAGRRDFPQAAVLGAVSAYLRPRVILILGSVAAVLLAASQVWLLGRQNTLIDQQNTLIRDQGLALRAQTAAALLADLDANPSEAKLSLLAAFGEVGLDSLLLLAEVPTGKPGTVSRDAIVPGIGRFSVPQRTAALSAFLLAHARSVELIHNNHWNIGNPSIGSGTTRTPLSDLVAGPLEEPQSKTAALEAMRATAEDLKDVVEALERTKFNLPLLKSEDHLKVFGLIGELYAEYFFYFDVVSLGAIDGQVPQSSYTDSNGWTVENFDSKYVGTNGFETLDDSISSLCPQEARHKNLKPVRRIGREIGLAIRDIASSPEASEVLLGTVVTVAIANVCLKGDMNAMKGLGLQILGDEPSDGDIRTVVRALEK